MSVCVFVLCLFVSVYVCLSICLFVYPCMYVCIYVCMYVCMHACSMHVCMLYVCMYVWCLSVCLSVYLSIYPAYPSRHLLTLVNTKALGQIVSKLPLGICRITLTSLGIAVTIREPLSILRRDSSCSISSEETSLKSEWEISK